MAADKRLLELRRQRTRVKPTFVVRAAHFAKRIKSRWRRARGRHSAIRQHHRGRPKQVSIGYRSPRAVRGLHSSGLERVIVHTVAELQQLNPKTQGAVLASTLGAKRRVQLLALAQEKKLPLLNVRDLAQAQRRIMVEFEARKKERQEKFQEKGKKHEEKKRKTEEKKKTESHTAEEKSTLGVEDKITREDQQRLEAEKTLIKKQ